MCVFVCVHMDVEPTLANSSPYRKIVGVVTDIIIYF